MSKKLRKLKSKAEPKWQAPTKPEPVVVPVPLVAPQALAAPKGEVVELPVAPQIELPEWVYADARAKALRWHGLLLELSELAETEKAKEAELKRLAAREAVEDVNLEAELLRAQKELWDTQRARERTLLRLAPALKAAWRATEAAHQKVKAQAEDYQKKAEPFRRFWALMHQRALREIAKTPDAVALIQGVLGYRHVEDMLLLPRHVAAELEADMSPEQALHRASMVGNEVYYLPPVQEAVVQAHVAFLDWGVTLPRLTPENLPPLVNALRSAAPRPTSETPATPAAMGASAPPSIATSVLNSSVAPDADAAVVVHEARGGEQHPAKAGEPDVRA